MELCCEIVEGLQIVGNSAHIADSVYPSFLDTCFNSIISSSVKYDIAVKPGVLKQAHGATVTFVLEAAKHDLHPTSISPVLEDCKFTQDRIDAFNDLYKKHKTDLQILLSSTGFNPAHIVDVDWRLDFNVKKKQVECVNEPVYTVSLQTQKCDQSHGQLQFSCTQEQLQDLVGKLKDACKSVERSAQM